ncbi:MerR family DNA-binding transcriptional regulator [Mycobacteriaceae bacterium Msp059]|nr:MerR family DNA-binding transcriptional regulator [Mycobacteriaceae bacterium Msp059]
MPAENSASDDDARIRPIEAARLAGVHIRTLARWEANGQLKATRTAAGHRRYRRGDVIALTTAQPA